ncbi:WD40 repeat-like protein [Setomelanomma holmii]|uniref:WD40 repeat-like protein n=1 Tax=Setomelanomma holmii TaxID=210430 RepID=A0A9P4LFR0_9PLEO|nr:WD40 repeat-like protein [Setomelanomma holmii]
MDHTSSPTLQTVIFVINALDECESESEIRHILKALSTQSVLNNVRLRVFITRRPEVPIRHSVIKIPEKGRIVFLLHEISSEVVDKDLSSFFQSNPTTLREERGFEPEDWPGLRTINRLVEISCGLFIWASIARRWIRQRKQAAEERIKTLIYVLRNAMAGGLSVCEKIRTLAKTKTVLGTIVILVSPLLVASLANLLCKPLKDVKGPLIDLHTIFHIPDHDDHPNRLHHPTFRDFIFDRNRCEDLDFWADARDAHKALADRCLDLMSAELRKDMCGLVKPGALLCKHYRQSGYIFCDGDRVDQFFRKHFLHWLEVINLIDKSAEMGAIIRLYHALLNIYCSGLAFIPSSSNHLRDHFRGELHSCIKEARIAEAILPFTKDEFNYVNDMSFSPDGRQIVSKSQIMAARLWDVATGAARHQYIGPKDKVSSVSISPDGPLLAGGSDDFTIWIWNLKTRRVKYHLQNAHAGWVNSVVSSPDGRWLASGSMDETVAIWNIATGQKLKRFANQSSCVNCVSFSPDGLMITTASVDQMVRLWVLSQDKPEMLTMFDGHSGPVNTVRISPDGRQIVSGADDRTIKLWDIAKEADIMTLQGHMMKVMTVIISRDGRFLVSGSEDITVRVWDAVLGSELHVLADHTSGLNSVVFSPNGKHLASCSFDDEVRLWDTEKWTLLRRFKTFKDDVDHVVQSDLLQPLISDSDDIMDVDDSHPASATIHSGAINHLDFSPDSHQLASASTDNTVRVCSTATGSSYPALQGHSDNVLRTEMLRCTIILKKRPSIRLQRDSAACFTDFWFLLVQMPIRRR